MTPIAGAIRFGTVYVWDINYPPLSFFDKADMLKANRRSHQHEKHYVFDDFPDRARKDPVAGSCP